jgi:hypothetical protein
MLRPYKKTMTFWTSGISILRMSFKMILCFILRFHFPLIPQQKGGTDCGPLAACAALSLAAGIDPLGKKINQEKCREHVLKCIFTEKILPPPFNGQYHVNETNMRTQNIPVICTCQCPVFISPVVVCEDCQQMFHKRCMDIDLQSDPDDVTLKCIQNKHCATHCAECSSWKYHGEDIK